MYVQRERERDRYISRSLYDTRRRTECASSCTASLHNCITAGVLPILRGTGTPDPQPRKSSKLVSIMKFS